MKVHLIVTFYDGYLNGEIEAYADFEEALDAFEKLRANSNTCGNCEGSYPLEEDCVNCEFNNARYFTFAGYHGEKHLIDNIDIR